MANMTVTTGAAFIPELWAGEAMPASEFAATIQKRVNRKLEKVATVGDTVHVPRRSNLSVRTKSADTDATFEAITEGTQDVTISTHQYAGFVLEQILEKQANQDLRQMYSKNIGYALSRATDVTLANLFASLSTNSVGTLAVEMTSDDYTDVWKKLAEAGLLETGPAADEDFSLFLSPAAYAAAMKVDVFANRMYNTDGDAIRRAHVGHIYSFRVFISNLLQSSGGGHYCAAFHRDCFALVLQKEVAIDSDHLIEKMGDAVLGWRLYGTAEMNFPPETAGGGTAVDNRGCLISTL